MFLSYMAETVYQEIFQNRQGYQLPVYNGRTEAEVYKNFEHNE